MKKPVKHQLPSASLCDRVLDLACAIQQVPSPTFSEDRRARWVHDCMLEEGLIDVKLDSCGNVMGRLPGAGARPVVISAHLDTVFPVSTPLTLTRTTTLINGPGIGDNSLGVAGLMGLVWLLKKRGFSLPGDLWLAANVGEEGLGNLKGMRTLVDTFNDKPLAYVILEGMGLGEIFHRGLAVRRFRIEAHTAGGHSWIDYGKPSAIHELAGVAARLMAVAIPREPRTSFNIGTFHGGTGINTIASEASMEVDLRSVSVESLSRLTLELKRLVADTNHSGVKCVATLIGERPSGEIPRHHPLVDLAHGTLKGLGIRPVPGIGSTDANIPISKGYPAVCLGLTSGGGAHTTDEYIRTAPLAYGLEQVYQIVTQIWETLK